MNNFNIIGVFNKDLNSQEQKTSTKHMINTF